MELSTTGHDPYHWHNYPWQIRGLYLGQVPEGGCTSLDCELQGCLGAPTSWNQVMSLLLKVCSCGKPVSPGNGMVEGGQQACTNYRTLQIQESETSRYIDRGAGIVSPYQVGRWILLQWWGLVASDTRREIPVPWTDVLLPNRFCVLKEDTWLEALYRHFIT